MKKKIIGTVICIISIVVAGLIAQLVFPKYSIPIGVLMAAIFFTVTYVFIVIIMIKQTIRESNKKTKVLDVVLSLVILLAAVFCLGRCVQAVCDIVSGPQEMVVRYARMQETHGDHTYRYFICETPDGENMKITIHSEKEYDHFAEVLSDARRKYSLDDAKYTVYYFENINVVYDVEIYE